VMFGPGDFVEVFQRAQKVNMSIAMCKSRKYHEIYFYFIKPISERYLPCIKGGNEVD